MPDPAWQRSTTYRMFVRPEGPAGEEGARLMARTGHPMAIEAVTALNLPDDAGAILEIGFGPGLALAELAKRYSTAAIYGLDPSTVMHRHASRRNRRSIEAGAVHLFEGTAEAIPLPSGSIDAVVAIDNLHFWPQPEHGLSEIRRVLVSGGRMICAFSPPSGGPPPGIERLFARSGFIDLSSRTSKAGFLLEARTP